MKNLSQNEWLMLLRHFTADPDDRPILAKPFEQSGYICAADTHILIQVNKKHVDGDFETRDTPNVARVIPKGISTYTINVAAIRNTLFQLGIDYNLFTADCPECNEECEVEWEYRDKDGDKHHMYATCPCCKGSGRIRNGSQCGVDIDGHVFSAHYLLLIYRTMEMLGIDKVSVLTGPRHNAWRFMIDGGITIVMMPIIETTAKIPTAQLHMSPIIRKNSQRSGHGRNKRL